MNRAPIFPLALLFAGAIAACSSDTRKAEDTLNIAADTPALTVPPMPAPTASGALLDPNTATEVEISGIPGLSTTVATKIVSGRPHTTMVSVNTALPPTLTENQRDSVYAHLWKPININTATDAEILLIPGVGNRMLREFKEYRPWTSIEQFRREIGKYVDKAELARLEKYIAIP
jgi:DNA uptake protein ComE-like DNA-binding protein